ncbi:MAG: NAD-dependent epimerase [Bacteroidota bacterium]
MTLSNPILITGTGGFIGFHLAKRLLSEGNEVVGVDSLNDYYEVSLKKDRNAVLKQFEKYYFYKQELEDHDSLAAVFKKHQPQIVVNLAAQAGVRYSLTNPHAYVHSNVLGFLNVLEACRHNQVQHLLYASSSSVYGANTTMPFSVDHSVDHPLSLYAASKKSNELMAHTYAASFGLPVTGLRFFTVYGPWGRPDMALFLFTKAILDGKPIDVYNHGRMKRDFTYVEDIVEGLCRLLKIPPESNDKWNSAAPDPGTSFAPYRLCNIGSNRPIELLSYIEAIEEKLQMKATKNFMPIQVGDVPETYAEVTHLEQLIDYKPSTPLKEGVNAFVDWYRDYYKV